MKKAAAILLLIFTLVQAGPVVCSFFSSNVTVFIADEEKGPEKTELEKKHVKKDYLSGLSNMALVNSLLKKAFHLSEEINLSPAPEKPTPPPDFS